MDVSIGKLGRRSRILALDDTVSVYRMLRYTPTVRIVANDCDSDKDATITLPLKLLRDILARAEAQHAIQVAQYPGNTEHV